MVKKAKSKRINTFLIAACSIYVLLACLLMGSAQAVIEIGCDRPTPQEVFPNIANIENLLPSPDNQDVAAFQRYDQVISEPQNYGNTLMSSLVQKWMRGQTSKTENQQIRLRAKQKKIFDNYKSQFDVLGLLKEKMTGSLFTTYDPLAAQDTQALGTKIKNRFTYSSGLYNLTPNQKIVAGKISSELESLTLANCSPPASPPSSTPAAPSIPAPPPPPPPPAPTKSFGAPVSCAPLSDDEVNNFLKPFPSAGLFSSTTMSPDARLTLAKKVRGILHHYSNKEREQTSKLDKSNVGYYLRIADPLARVISGSATSDDFKFLRMAMQHSTIAFQGIEGNVDGLIKKYSISLEDKPNFFFDLYKDVGTIQYGDTLKKYLANLGIPEDSSKYLIQDIKTIKFASNCSATVTIQPPTSPDQMVPCGPVTTTEMQTIFPKHTITLAPPAKSPAEITNFQTQLTQMFNVKDDVKPADTQFYKNVMLWANNQLTPKGHQLLRYTIEQLKILLGTYAPETFDFKAESEKFAAEIDITSTKYWEEFYGHTLANTKPEETDRLVQTLEYMNDRLSRPLDPKNKMGPDAQNALLVIIGELKALKLAPGCPATFAPAPVAAPAPTLKPAPATPPAAKPAVPPRSAPAATPKPAPAPTPKPAFDTNYYLSNAPVLKNMTQNMTKADRDKTVWEHYINTGVNEERKFQKDLPPFSVVKYLSLYPDLKTAFGGIQNPKARAKAAVTHYFKNGIKEGRKYVD